MPKQRKAENETMEEADIRRLLERVSNTANRSDKVSWNRKMDNMVKLVAQLTPIQEQILELEASKTPILDQIAELRTVMVNECIHPYKDLVFKDNHVYCKFCNKKIVVNNAD